MDSADEQEPSASPPASSEPAWIGRREIAAIPGALKASAYVARAYHHQKEQGTPPAWARKQPGGQWLFDRQYIAADARENAATIGITEAATLVGVTRRAVQTWVDEGVIPTAAGDRHKGESRRIPRDAFLKVLPDLLLRLRPAAPSPVSRPADDAPAPSPPASEASLRAELQRQAAAEESRLAADVNREIAEAASTRQQIARKREVAERRLRNLARDEQRAQEREARLKDRFAERLRHAQQDSRAADRRRAAAEELARRTAAKEQEALAEERQLRETLAQRLAEWRRRSAALIATQLQEARALFSKPAPAPPPQVAHSEQQRRRSAAAVASQLHAARAEVRQRSQLEEEVEQIAARLSEEVASGHRDRYDAAILFNDIMDKRDVPDEVRIAILKRHFSNKPNT